MYANSAAERDEWMEAITAAFAMASGDDVAGAAVDDAASTLSSLSVMSFRGGLPTSPAGSRKLGMPSIEEEERISRRKLEQLTTPFRCYKKLDFESDYQERFVWVDITNGTLHWSKTADGKRSKHFEVREFMINIETMVLPTAHPNLKITLDPEYLPPALVTGTGMLKKAACSIDIYVNTPAPFGADPAAIVAADTELCEALCMLLLKVKRNVKI